MTMPRFRPMIRLRAVSAPRGGRDVGGRLDAVVPIVDAVGAALRPDLVGTKPVSSKLRPVKMPALVHLCKYQ